MSAIALEVNDAGFLLMREGEPRPRPESPGLALFEGESVVVGAAAATRARVLPRAVHDRFWDPLGAEPLGPQHPPGLRRADVAHAHLRSLRDALEEAPAEAFLAVPGFWSRPALGLLLSLARSAGFPVTGLVDSAVAGAAFFVRGEGLLHLDLTRHRSIVTTLHAGSEVQRVRVSESEGSGQAAFERTLVEAIARRFVRETRFDPLHSGASEQWLHDTLPTWLAELRRGETCPVRVTAGRREHRLELSRDALASDLDPLYGSVLQQVAAAREGPVTTLLVSARAARLPGFVDRLRAVHGPDVVELPHDAAVSATLRLRDHIRRTGEALPFVARLPLPGHVAARPGRRPTHLMNGGVAHAIADGLTLGTAPPPGGRGLGLRQPGIAPHHCSLVAERADVRLKVVPGASTWLNDVPAEDGSALRAGDRLRLGAPGVELQLVAVEDEG